MISGFCLICDESVAMGKGIILTNGKVIHKSCYWQLLRESSSLSIELEKQKNSRAKLFKKLNSKPSFLSVVISTFRVIIWSNAAVPSKEDLQNQIIELDFQCGTLQKQIEKNKSLLTHIYSFWSTYPPDWNDRKNIAMNKNNVCSECGKKRSLHLHHIIHIGLGGSHELSNLELLCSKCHRKKHKTKKSHHKEEERYFEEKKSDENSFAQRSKIIKTAISQNSDIKFYYTNYSKTYTIRTIKPRKIEKVKTTICVHGWCYLRNENRVFAIKRMRRVQVVSGAPKSIDNSAKKKKVAIKKRTTPKRKVAAPRKVAKKPKVSSVPETPTDDMYEQLRQHDLENLRLMGYDTDE